MPGGRFLPVPDHEAIWLAAQALSSIAAGTGLPENAAMTGQDWQRYYHATDGRPPRPTLVWALQAFAAEGRGPGLLAVDLGCGSGRDALPMLRAGWRVWAIDAAVEGLARLERQAEAEALTGFITVEARFEDAALPACELVNASFSLFACPPERFAGLWAAITAAIRPGGRFAGQLLGPKDSWAARPATTIVSRAELDAMLAPFAIERIEEEEADSVTPMGEAKHWHIWHLNARKQPS